MTLDADSISVAQGGHVYIADAETVEPAFGTEPGPEWADLGFVDEPGVTYEQGITITGTPAWQARGSVRDLVTDEPFTAAFTIIEFRPTVLAAALRGGVLSDAGSGLAAVFSPPAAGANPIRALYITEEDEDVQTATWIARAQINQAVSWVLARASAKKIPMTWNALDPSTGDRFHVTSNMPAWLAELASSS